MIVDPVAGWSSLAARRAHNPKVVGSNPTPATKIRSMQFRSLKAEWRCVGFRPKLCLGRLDVLDMAEVEQIVGLNLRV